jgi:PAS domain S-box-containing protein
VGLVRDITERKRQQEHLQQALSNLEEREQRLQSVLHTAVDGIITIDDRFCIEHFNPAAERIFGYEAEEVIGKNVKLLMPEPYHSEHDGYVNNYKQSGNAKIIGLGGRELQGRRKDGSTFPLELGISEIKLQQKERSFVGIVRDITARKLQEDTLRATLGRLATYTNDLERSNQELDEFAYIASHDLKEPLRGIHNHSRFLLEDYENLLDDDGTRRLNRLIYLTQRMERLVNDLLYFSRIGRQDLAFRQTDLNAVIKDVVSTIEQFLEDRHAKVVVNGTLPTIYCDVTRITEVFRNLISNAVKYNDKVEKIVEVGLLDEHPDPDGKSRRNVFYVRDNGKGIPKEFYGDIFRIFKRLEKGDGMEDGTGVGLTFVKKIILRHNGTIWLESALGVGTAFYFTLEAA